MSDKRYDVIIYHLESFRVTGIFSRNLPRRGDTFSADSMENQALLKTNTRDNGVAIVEHKTCKIGDVYQE